MLRYAIIAHRGEYSGIEINCCARWGQYFIVPIGLTHSDFRIHTHGRHTRYRRIDALTHLSDEPNTHTHTHNTTPHSVT